jgi:hypothetical protein
MQNIPVENAQPYEPPRVETIGSVHALTQGLPTKQFGHGDGYFYAAPQVTNAGS